MTVKKKIALSISIVIIIMILIIYFIILPTVNEIENISKAVYIERVDLEKKYLRGQLLRKTIENFEKIEPQKDRLASIFIIEGEELKFITQLEKIATLHNLKQNLRLETADSKNQDYYSLSSEVSINGQFINILKYLESLEQSDYYFNIFSLAINAAVQNEVTAKLKGQIFAIPAFEE